MTTRVDHYRACAASCAAVDYASRRSVLQHNRASEEMRKVVAEAYCVGPGAVAELLPLLDEPSTEEWLAFQLLDLGVPPPAVAARCLAIVRRKAAGTGADAMGAGMWLREWEARHNEPDAAPSQAAHGGTGSS